ncbi:hypothetical protein D3Z36_17275 [Lachnospiraceae bacterium]|nr:hypothetical protein [Lachnospiraceae bacterium]
MVGNTPKRKIRDSVFTNLFQDKKYLLQLYQTLHPEDKDVTEDGIADVTVRNVLVDADYNDLGFSIGDRLVVLVESQSTFTYNIVIRALLYLAQTYHEYFVRTNQNKYGSKKLAVPKPELYMVFTGERKNIPDIMSLKEDFFSGEDTAIDVKVKVLYQENESDIIGQYIIFCKVYSEQRKLHGSTKEAVTETISICKDRNILKGYLESKEKEVVDIMMALFDDEQIMKAYAKDIEIETAKETAKEKAKLMLKNDRITVDEISIFFPELTEADIKEIEAEVLQLS